MPTPLTIENSVEAYLSNEDSPDISNPIHSSEVAATYGFSGALVGGVTVWGWATETILEALGPEWLSSGWSEFSFKQPTIPGDILQVRAVQTDDNSDDVWDITMTNQQGILNVSGRVGLEEPAWSREFPVSSYMDASAAPPIKETLDLGNAKINTDWTPMTVDFSEDLAAEFASEKQRAANPLFYGENGIAHPAWVAGWSEQLLRHNFDIPSSIHTRSQIQHLRPVPVGSKVTGGARLLEVYERKAHHFAHFNVILQDERGQLLSRIAHWTIFRIATVAEREKILS